MTGFEGLGLKKEIVDILSSLKIRKPLDVQAKIIPLAMTGKNIVFTSRTGSGKTFAYLLGLIGKIKPKQNIQLLVLVPTRELCIQVGKELMSVASPLGLKVGMLYGGREINGDYRTTSKRLQILVGTPGRLIQHINEKTIKVGDVKYLVYDESDQMFDNGFYDEWAYLRKRVSSDAQVILSSAMRTEKVDRFITTVILDYELIDIGELIPKGIIQEKLYCEKLEKKDILLRLFLRKKFKRAMVFCNTKIKSADISEFLNRNNLKTRLLNSDLRQDDRLNTLNLFKEGKLKVLVVTDVAARGLHITDVDIIVNYDAPTRSEFYIHRIGRTGRGGKPGYALSFICPEDVERFALIESLYALKVGIIKGAEKSK